jgi:outer membrane protein TolC
LFNFLKTLTLVTATLLALPAFASDAELLTLKGAIQEAEKANPGLQRSQAALDEAAWRPLEAGSGQIPHLFVSANHLFDVKYQVIELSNGGLFDAVYPKSILSLGASWTVFDGLKTWNAFQGAWEGKHAAEKELSRTKFLLESEVRLRYYQSLAALGLLTVAAQIVKTLMDHLARTKELLAHGQATKFDVLRTQTQLEEAEPDEIQAEDELSLARVALARALGKDAESRQLSSPLPLPPSDPAWFTPEKIRPEPEGRDDIQALLMRADAAGDNKASTVGNLLPQVSLAATQDIYNNINSSLTDGFRTAHSVGVYLTWNLFDGGQSLARIKAAGAQAAQADAAARAAQIRAPGELDQWRRRLLYSMSLFKARTRAIESAQESLRLAKLGYGAGTRTNTDVLDAELDLFRASAGRIRAQVDALEALLNLEAALGRRLRPEDGGSGS